MTTLPRERVLYILGAGFSAPLGLPVMKNFIEKAHDLLERDPDGLAHFRTAIERIDELAKIKHYFTADLFNIEEALSIEEMRRDTAGESTADLRRFVSDVVQQSTPALQPVQIDALRAGWLHSLFGRQDLYRAKYAHFVGNLLNRVIKATRRYPDQDTPPCFSVETEHEPAAIYSVVSFNYDLVLERFAALSGMGDARSNGFRRPTAQEDVQPWNDIEPLLAKIHGCVSDESVVPPTWAKNVSDRIRPAWKAAYQLLRGATSIRILGYSLPSTDSYFRYLLKAAAPTFPSLKTFDVVCLDPDGSVEKRYRELVAFDRMRFRNADVLSYLAKLPENADCRAAWKGTPSLRFAGLEPVHEDFFS